MFRWIPGRGVDASALARLQSQFVRPRKPMGEAWFMGVDRRMFTELLGDLDSISAFELQEPLQEIANGISCFGPYDEWLEWYHFLLGALIPRAHENFVTPLLELLATDLFAAYPDGIDDEPYRGFRDDMLLTLGSCLMNAECWSGRTIRVGQFLHRSNDNPAGIWSWWDASGDLSASLFLCLKYLPADLVEPWFRSALEIHDPHWRAQLIVWLAGAHQLLTDDIQWPSQFHENARPAVNWDWSHCLRPDMPSADGDGMRPTGPFLPIVARETVLGVCKSYFSDDVYLDWLISIESVANLALELGEIPARFEEMFVGRVNP